MLGGAAPIFNLVTSLAIGVEVKATLVSTVMSQEHDVSATTQPDGHWPLSTFGY